MGSAVRESQKDVASWTGQVNILKNNWDEFINSIVNSNDAINVLKTLNKVLDTLQATTKGLGGLGTVSTLIAGIAGLKGAGIGSSILSMIQASKSAITVEDVAMLRQYNALLANGASVAEAEAVALNDASVAAHNMARAANGAAVKEEILAQAENKVTLGARAGAVATKALGTAFNVAFNMGVIALISLAVKVLSNLADKIITTKEELEEIRQQSLQTVETFQSEAKALDEIVVEYNKIITSTTDLKERKEQLTDLQERLVDKYKDEADGIDLVNGKISENIRLLDEKRRKDAEDYIKNNRGTYESAVSELSQNRNYGFNAVGIKSFAASEEMRQYLLSLDNVVKDEKSAIGLLNDLGGDFYLSGTYEEILESLSLIRDYYADMEGHETRILTQLDNEISSISKIVEENKALTAEMEKQKAIKNEPLMSDQEYNMIEQATQAYREYQIAINNEDNQAQANALNVLNGIRDVVYSLAPAGSALRQEFDKIWDGFNLGAEEALSNMAALKADFDEYVDNTYKEELKNIESIQKAINTFLEDGTISHDDAWALFDLDTEKILADIQIIDGQYKLSTEQLVKLMQQQIDKQKESILTTKTEAEEQLALAKAKLASIKVNSVSDAKYYAAEIQEASDNWADAKDMIEKCDYLLAELNGRMVSVEKLTDATAKNLNAQVKALEAEVDAIDDTLDSLNDRKEILNDEKDALQEQLDILNEQKEAIEDTIKNYDAVADAIDGYVKKQTDVIQDQIDAMEEAAEAIKKNYDEQIESLEEQNDERDDAIKKEKALADLQDAKSQKKRVYSAERGWEWQSSKEDILKASNELAKIENEERIKALEKERDDRLAAIEERKDIYNQEIKAYENYASKYSGVASDIKQTDNELLANEILGSDWRERAIAEAKSTIKVALSEEQKEIVEDYEAIVQEIKDSSIDLNKTIFGNIDTNQRQVLEWNEENLNRFADSIESWGESAEDLKGSISTVFGAWDTFDGVDIAFSPMLQTQNGAELLDVNTVTDYIYEIVKKAGDNLSKDNILALDTIGLNLDGKAISGLIADVGKTAEATSKAMHYAGKDGAYALTRKQIEKVAETLGVGVEAVLNTNEALTENSEMLNKYESEYKEFDNQLKSLVNNEIADTQRSIDAKQAEIDQVEKEIKAYNKYKTSVEKALSEAKENVENYKAAVLQANSDIIESEDSLVKNTADKLGLVGGAFAGLETAIWHKRNDIVNWVDDISNAINNLQDELGAGAIGALGMGLSHIMGSHAKGGVADYTGLAMLHGSKSNPETIFNSADSAKLYELVHNTPNLVASLAQQSMQVLGRVPSINNSATNASISVSIGQIVANNPQELTRNLDTHLDSYFKRKLTQSYVQ